MSETYCGKSCQTCGYRAETGCRGCREQASRECKLALCCRQKGHETCESCVFNTQCGMYQGRNTAPQFRLAQKKAVLEYQQELKRKGTCMAKWVWVLFWLFIPSNIATVMTNWIPALETAGYILSFICTAVYGGILWKLSSEEKGYRTAGELYLVAAVLSLATIAASYVHVFLIIMLSVVNVVVAMFGYYYEFNAHADVLEGLDNELSEQWRKLWKWMLGATIAMVVGLVFTVIVIGALVALAAAVAVLVIGILKLVYLYRTAQAFQDVAAS